MSPNFPAVSALVFTPASERLRETGLLGFVACTLDDHLRVDGITVRRTMDRRLTLAYPERRDGGGRSHSIIRPVSDDARLALERQVFDALGLDPGAWAR